MHIDDSPAQRALRNELRAYFKEIITDEVMNEFAHDPEGGGPLFRRTMEQMGKDGWLGVGWPKEFGGKGFGIIEQTIFSSEIQRVGFPLPFLTINSVAPMIMKYGTDEQRQKFLPRILAGKCFFSIGYSEPSAGTDLAALKSRAEPDGDGWLINGSKVFTSLAQYADYIWLAVRTDPNVSKHQGISMFIVDTKDPGFSWHPTNTMSSISTTSTYYENIRVTEKDLVGGLNMGWRLITGQLNQERISLVVEGPLGQIIDESIAWAKETKVADGTRLIDEPWVQSNLARVRAKQEALKLMCWKQAWATENGTLQFADASAMKVYGTELFIEAYQLLMEVYGNCGVLRRGSRGSVLKGRVEIMYRAMLILTFGGGTNEIQRDIIAVAGLGMPAQIR
jgi:alkylation response protein AidB-like acyl-CoA dehydrogenase